MAETEPCVPAELSPLSNNTDSPERRPVGCSGGGLGSMGTGLGRRRAELPVQKPPPLVSPGSLGRLSGRPARGVLIQLGTIIGLLIFLVASLHSSTPSAALAADGPGDKIEKSRDKDKRERTEGKTEKDTSGASSEKGEGSEQDSSEDAKPPEPRQQGEKDGGPDVDSPRVQGQAGLVSEPEPTAEPVTETETRPSGARTDREHGKSGQAEGRPTDQSAEPKEPRPASATQPHQQPGSGAAEGGAATGGADEDSTHADQGSPAAPVASPVAPVEGPPAPPEGTGVEAPTEPAGAAQPAPAPRATDRPEQPASARRERSRTTTSTAHRPGSANKSEPETQSAESSESEAQPVEPPASHADVAAPSAVALVPADQIDRMTAAASQGEPSEPAVAADDANRQLSDQEFVAAGAPGVVGAAPSTAILPGSRSTDESAGFASHLLDSSASASPQVDEAATAAEAPAAMESEVQAGGTGSNSPALLSETSGTALPMLETVVATLPQLERLAGVLPSFIPATREPDRAALLVFVSTLLGLGLAVRRRGGGGALR